MERRKLRTGHAITPDEFEELAEVLGDLEDPRHEEVLRRAHEVDDLLAAS